MPIYTSTLDLTTVACTVCGEFNLDEYLCYNCKGSLECTDCCGCYELEEKGLEEEGEE